RDAHCACDGRWVGVGDRAAGRELTGEKLSLVVRDERHEDRDVCFAGRRNHVVEGDDVRQERDGGLGSGPADPAPLVQVALQRALDVVAREVRPAAVLVEPELDLGRAPDDPVTAVARAPDRPQPHRDLHRRGAAGRLGRGTRARRGLGVEEPRRVWIADQRARRQHDRAPSAEQPPHRAGGAPSPLRRPLSTTAGSRSSESIRARTDSSASRNATRSAWRASRWAPTPLAAEATDDEASRRPAAVAPSRASPTPPATASVAWRRLAVVASMRASSSAVRTRVAAPRRPTRSCANWPLSSPSLVPTPPIAPTQP